MKLLAKYLKPYMVFALASPLLMAGEVVMDLMQPTLMARIVDVGIATLDMHVILRTGGLMVLLSLFGACGGIGGAVTASIAAGRMAEDLRTSVFDKVMGFSYQNIDSLQTGSIITRLTNDVTQVENTVRMLLRIMVRAPLMVVGSLVMAIILSPPLGLVLLAAAPLIIVVFVLIIRKAYPLYMKVQERMDRLNTRVFENLAGIRLVKSFVRRAEEERRFGEDNSAFAETSVRAGRVTALVHPSTQIILYLAVATVLWIGGVRVVGNQMPIGRVVAVVNYLMQMLNSLIMVSHLIMQLSRSQASITRITEILASESEIVEPLAPDPPSEEKKGRGSLSFTNVTFGYGGPESEPVLKDISFEVSPGEKIAILGETGSGKSSLVHLIPRLYDVGTGAVSVNGIDVRCWPTLVLRKKIGMAAQQAVLFSGSFESNIGFGCDISPDYHHAASVADISGFIESMPEAYGTDLNQRGLNLSGGQKQRVSIARALAMDPEILILDDATSAVDLTSEARILTALDEHKEQTVIIVAQRIATAMRADRIVLLDSGRVAASGTHAELMDSSPLYREIYESQLGNPEAIDV